MEAVLKRSPPLPEEIDRLVREEIRSGRLAPGGRLPTEHQMSRTYGVSRTVVREAISRLKNDGLVVSHQGRGVFVSPDGGASTFRLDAPDLEDQTELSQVIELLIAVEAAATELAARRRKAGQLKAMKRALDEMARAIELGQSGVEEDFRFHSRIVEATGNPFFQGFSRFLEHRVRNLIRAARSNTSRVEGLAHSVQAEHVAIYEAIAAGDPAGARAAAETHLRNAAARLQLYQRNAMAAGAGAA